MDTVIGVSQSQNQNVKAKFCQTSNAFRTDISADFNR